MNGTRADQIDVPAARDRQTHVTEGLDLKSALLAPIPVALGIAAAMTADFALGRWAPEASLSWMRALTAVSCWLYLGYGLRLGLSAGLVNAAVAVGLFGLAVASRGAGVDLVAAGLLAHAAWSLVLAWRSSREPDTGPSVWMAWGSFHGALALVLVLT